MAEHLKTIRIPDYTKSEEKFNSISHFVGVVLSIIGFLILLLKTLTVSFSARNLISSIVCGLSFILLFSGSSVYHYLDVNNKKRIMRVFDHCNVYIAISGAYTPFLLTKIYDYDKSTALKILVIMWCLVLALVVMTFVNMDGFKELLHTCYVAMGVAVMVSFIPFGKVFGKNCLCLIVCGGVLAAIGAVMYGVGSKKKWFHSIFHVIILVSCIFFYLSIALYVI